MDNNNSSDGLADTFQDIADLFRRRRFKAALNLINVQLERYFRDPFICTRLTVLQVYCHLKLANYVAASIPLDALSMPPTDPMTLKQSLRCSSDDFTLQVLAAIFPLCVSQVASHDISQVGSPFPKPQNGSSLERLYLLLDWCRQCISDLHNTDQISLLSIWTERHILVIGILVDALTQLEIYEVALSLIHSDILSKQTKSSLGLSMLGGIYVAMGDLQSADYHLGIAECLNDATEQKPLITATNGLLQMARGNFSAATVDFNDAVKHSRESSAQKTISQCATVMNKKLATGELELTISINNYAVGLLYNGAVRDATQHLESSLTSSTERPFPYLVGLRNLITLYEFAPQRGRKTAALRKTLSEFDADEFELLNLFNTSNQTASHQSPS